MAGGTETLFCVEVTGVGSSCSNIVLEALVRSHNMAARGPSRESRPGLGASFMSLTTVLSLLQL